MSFLRFGRLLQSFLAEHARRVGAFGLQPHVADRAMESVEPEAVGPIVPARRVDVVRVSRGRRGAHAALDHASPPKKKQALPLLAAYAYKYGQSFLAQKTL
jgi:hypothetical protein